MTVPTDLYDAAVENTAKANEALAAFFTFPEKLEVRTESGSGSREWFVINLDTYDGEQIAMFSTPLEAITNWHEEVSS